MNRREQFERLQPMTNQMKLAFIDICEWADNHPCWTPCETKPEKTGYYLCALELRGSYTVNVWHYEKNEDIWRGGNQWVIPYDENDPKKTKVIAWMPMPKFNPEEYK